jgi:hypothetical protein
MTRAAAVKIINSYHVYPMTLKNHQAAQYISNANRTDIQARIRGTQIAVMRNRCHPWRAAFCNAVDIRALEIAAEKA